MCHLQKFTDDSFIMACIDDGSEEELRGVVGSFVCGFEKNRVILNVSDTKELGRDLWRSGRKPTSSWECTLTTGWSDADVAHRKGLRFFNAPPTSSLFRFYSFIYCILPCTLACQFYLVVHFIIYTAVTS